MSGIISSDVPILVAMGAYWRDGLVLGIRRAQRSNYPGFWTFPGGKREYEETMLDTLVREFSEEAGLHVIAVRAKVDVTQYTRGEMAYGHEVPQSCRVTCFTVTEAAGLCRGVEEGTAAGWFTASEMLKLDLIPSVRAYLEKNWVGSAQSYLGNR